MEFQCEVFGLDSATIGDAGTCCAVADPEGLVTTRYPVQVVLGDGIGRGQTLVDRRIWDGDRRHDPNPLRATEVDVALAIDGPRYRDLWLATVGG